MELHLSLLVGLLSLNGILAGAENTRPHILIIASDDHSYADVGVHGSSVKNEDWGPGGANQKNATLEKLLTEGRTERERLLLAKGIFNAEFPYLGSAKILGGVGEGLAEAMAELKQPKKPH